MEIIKYNKEMIEIHFEKEQYFSDILHSLEKMAERDSKVICKIAVNGLKFSELDELKFADANKSDINAIEIELESVDALTTASVATLQQFSRTVKENSIACAEAFRLGSELSAHQHFTKIIPDFQCMTDALTALKPRLFKRFGDESHLLEKWTKAEEHLRNTIHELIVAFEKQDFVLVSDLLEYEVTNSIESWLHLLDHSS